MIAVPVIGKDLNSKKLMLRHSRSLFIIYVVAGQVGIQTFSIYPHIAPHKYMLNLKISKS